MTRPASQSFVFKMNLCEPLATPVTPVLNIAAFIEGENNAGAYLTCEMNSWRLILDLRASPPQPFHRVSPCAKVGPRYQPWEDRGAMRSFCSSAKEKNVGELRSGFTDYIFRHWVRMEMQEIDVNGNEVLVRLQHLLDNLLLTTLEIPHLKSISSIKAKTETYSLELKKKKNLE